MNVKFIFARNTNGGGQEQFLKWLKYFAQPLVNAVATNRRYI